MLSRLRPRRLLHSQASIFRAAVLLYLNPAARAYSGCNQCLLLLDALLLHMADAKLVNAGKSCTAFSSSAADDAALPTCTLAFTRLSTTRSSSPRPMSSRPCRHALPQDTVLRN
jgi:hypothetical protein